MISYAKDACNWPKSPTSKDRRCIYVIRFLYGRVIKRISGVQRGSMVYSDGQLNSFFSLTKTYIKAYGESVAMTTVDFKSSVLHFQKGIAC